jgi:signal peptidase I
MARRLEQYSYQVRKEKQKKTEITILFIVVIFVLINVINTFLIFPVRQISTSMTPDVPQNSYVMVTPLLKNYSRGDVVLVKSKYSSELSNTKKIWSLFSNFFTARQYKYGENKDYPGTKQSLRRVICVPGDTFYMRDYVLYIKPQGQKHFLTEFEINNHPYNVTFFVAPPNWDSSIGLKGSFDEITLKEGEYFVLSDNRKSSDDSRIWGVISKNDFAGKALFCYLPLNKFKHY